MGRRTKIVCTIGPASETVEILHEMIKAGMDVARLNFSHGNYEEHRARIQNIRAASRKAGKPVAILLDTKGPEIRLGIVAGGKATLVEGQELVLTTEAVEGTAERLPISYAGLPQDIKAGDAILIDDGNIGLTVLGAEGTEIRCKVTNGGDVSSRKGVSCPGVKVNMPAISEKEIADLEFGVAEDLDYIAISFVRRASDVIGIRRLLENRGASIPLIAKIENLEGVENLDEILKVADGMMVARGDLGVEIPTEEVPLVQKRIIRLCNMAGKPVITATQMLDSMIRNPRPTRAEATDVANAILDGTDAIMLSGETAAGKYPLLTVQTMARIASRAEEELRYEDILRRFGKREMERRSVTDAISFATCSTAADLRAKVIITATKSGFTARMVSRYRPRAPILAATPDERAMRKLALIWGVYPILVKDTQGTDQMIEEAVSKALATDHVEPGDLVVISAGVPAGISGTTNLLKVQVIGEVWVQGTGIGTQSTAGKLRICRTARDAEGLEKGEILVALSTDADFVPAMEKAAGVITEEGGITSHAAIVGLQFNIPVIVGVSGATDLLKTGETVTLDPQRGLVYRGIAQI